MLLRGKEGPEVRLAALPVRPELPPAFVALRKRRRIIAAVTELTAQQGYGATTISDIVKRAGVARKTLYENFEGKEETFLAAFDAAVEEAIDRVEENCASAEGGWMERVEAGLAAFLRYLASHPAQARMCLVEALSATPAATKRYEDAVQLFVDLTRRNLPHDDRLPDTIEETLVGGVVWIVYQQVRRHRTERVEELLPELLDFIVAPYLGVGDISTGDLAAHGPSK